MQGEHEYHIPVLAEQAIEALSLRSHGVYVDATLGGGGYSEMILMRSEGTKLIGFDTDPQAHEYASRRLAQFGDRFTLVKENFSALREGLANEGISQIDGIVYDLGVSSRQLDTTSVGLSYRFDAPLDMRLDPRLPRSAMEIIATSSAEELKGIFGNYGEEPMSGRIARWIVESREQKPVRTTHELAAIVTRGIREDKKNATLSRIFQALRIEVNDELGSLSTSLEEAMEVLVSGGRLVVVSYHSLEDRIVKDFLASHARPKVVPGSLESLRQSIDEAGAQLRLVTKKPVTPDEEEIEANPRARSAKMRVAEKK
ncbi:MAG: 16S rRNA (cytosine(1402)-N(4))-methyltransferase RsmH [Ignavibacteriota bacterium]